MDLIAGVIFVEGGVDIGRRPDEFDSRAVSNQDVEKRGKTPFNMVVARLRAIAF